MTRMASLANGWARHMFDQLLAALLSGVLMIPEEPRLSRKQNMDFLRRLAKYPQNPDR